MFKHRVATHTEQLFRHKIELVAELVVRPQSFKQGKAFNRTDLIPLDQFTTHQDAVNNVIDGFQDRGTLPIAICRQDRNPGKAAANIAYVANL